mmetsp:Transcript_14835/g.29253  ORF Transcript_14835/g.29253 Transcript_14835/m.29253 type:complete len:632 (-) Transcript_14835:214-2109(-)
MSKIVRVVPPLPSTERGVFCQVASDGPGERVLYCAGSNVVWRSVAPLLEDQAAEKIEDIFCWKQHVKQTTCVAISPNGNWVVSGDVTGAIRIWGSRGDNLMKAEYKLWDGVVKDVSFSGDSTRIVAAGDGKETKAVALIMDTGARTGHVGGHTKQVNSISFRSQRPFRIITGSEDMGVACHEGPPFALKTVHNVHTNFVNCVRYSPDGEWAVSVGSDSKACLYKGKESELVGEFQKPAGIAGTLWAMAWAPDSVRFVTAGGDKNLRIWCREAMAQIEEAKVGRAALQDMQMGVTWQSTNRIISVCLDGRLLFWDDKLNLLATVDGTQGPLTCVTCEMQSGVMVRGGTAGSIAVTLPGQTDKQIHIGKTVSHVITRSASVGLPAEVWAISVDGCIRRFSVESGELVGEPIELKEAAIGADWLDSSQTYLLVMSTKGNLHAVIASGIAWTKLQATPRAPTALGVLAGDTGRVVIGVDKPDGSVGGVESSQFDMHLMTAEDSGPDTVAEQAVLSGHKSEVSVACFHPNGDLLASADAGKNIFVWKLENNTAVLQISNWCLHTARITSLDWMPGGRRLVSGSLDRHVIVWDVDAPSEKLKVLEAHKGGVTSVAACNEKTFASVGYDGFTLIHELA